MAKKTDKQLYWLGPGSYGFGKKALNPGDPIPEDFPKENLERFEDRIGEKVVKQVALNQQARIKELTAENTDLKTQIEILKKENTDLKTQIEKFGSDK